MKKLFLLFIIMLFVLPTVTAWSWNVSSTYVRYRFDGNYSNTGTYTTAPTLTSTNTAFSTTPGTFVQGNASVEFNNVADRLDGANTNLAGSSGTGDWFFLAFQQPDPNPAIANYIACIGNKDAGGEQLCLATLLGTFMIFDDANTDYDTTFATGGGGFGTIAFGINSTNGSRMLYMIENITNTTERRFTVALDKTIGGASDITIGANLRNDLGGFNGFIDNAYWLNHTPNNSEIKLMLSLDPDDVPDSQAPAFSNIVAFPASPATYTLGQVYQFNTSWTDNTAVTNVTIEHNFFGTLTNFTVNPIGNTYSYTTQLGAGSYVWRQYAFDNAGNRNVTPQQSYTVNQAPANFTLRVNGLTNDFDTLQYRNLSIQTILLNGMGNIDVFINGAFFASGQNISAFHNFSTLGITNVTARLNSSQNFSMTSRTILVTVETDTNEFDLFTCPSTTFDFMLFVFFGVMLFAMMVVVTKYFRVPIMGVLIGVGVLFYAIPVLMCSTVFGIVLIVFAIMIMGSSIMLGWNG